MGNIFSRINWIDWAKTIGICLVIIGHTHLSGYEYKIKYFIYLFHMPFFFLISGYLHKRNDDYKSYFRKTFASIIIPYFLLNFLVFIFINIPSAIFSGDFNYYMRENFLSIFTGSGFIPASTCWFLLAIFWIRLLVYWLLKLKTVYIILVIFLIISIAYYIDLSVVNFVNIPYYITQALLVTPFYVAGYYLHKTRMLEKTTKYKYSLFSFFLLLIIVCYKLQYPYVIDIWACKMGKDPILYYLGSFAGAFMLIFASQFFDRKTNSLVQTISTGIIFILATHQAIYVFITNIAFKEFVQFGITYSLVYCLSFIIFSYYMIRIIQKYCPILIGNRKIRI